MAHKHAGEVSSSQLGVTSMDMPTFEALTLNDDTSHTFESPDSEIQQKYWPPKNQGDISFAKRQDEKEYAESQAQGQYSYASKEEIARNAKKWLCEEAIRRYIESKDDLKDLEYVFDELLHECFYVEHDAEPFYHFNFTVKIKKRCSVDWTSAVYFADVRVIRGIKHYFCRPLDPNENGQCYACPNKGMHELRHPVGIYPSEEYHPVIGYWEDCESDDECHPAVGGSQSDDECHPTVGGSESDDDMS